MIPTIPGEVLIRRQYVPPHIWNFLVERITHRGIDCPTCIQSIRLLPGPTMDEFKTLWFRHQRGITSNFRLQ